MGCLEGTMRTFLQHCADCSRCLAAFLNVEAPLCAFCMEGALLMDTLRAARATIFDAMRVIGEDP